MFFNTIGDSTIDNYFWTYGNTYDTKQARKDSVEGQIQEKLLAEG